MRNGLTTVGAILIGAALLIFTACATAPDPGPEPEVAIEAESPAFISPESSEGVQDVFEAEVMVVTPLDVGLRTFRITVEDDAGNVVRTIEKTAPDENATIEPLESVVWDGRNDEVDFVTQGKYTITVTIVDEFDRRARTDPFIVVVDNEAPRVEVSTPYTVFSPDGDGSKDVFYVRQQGSIVESWMGTFLNDDGEAVRTFSWSNAEPPRVAWDGRTDAGEVAPDGSYRYRLVGEDAAGNRTSATVTEIRLNTTDYSVSAERDRAAFSPNGDDRADVLTFSFSVPDRAGTAVDWIFAIHQVGGDGDATGSPVFTREGSGTPPDSITYRGETGVTGTTGATGATGTTGTTGATGESGKSATIAEGRYRGTLEVTFQNGDTSAGSTAPFVVDVTPPQVSATAGLDVFSPNGDGNKERLPLEQSASGATRWRGAVLTSGDESVREYQWSGNLPSEIAWAGENNAGEEVPDGSYAYRLTAFDRAGNRNSVETAEFVKDTSEVPEVSLEPSTLIFSPDGDGRKDLLRLDPGAATTEGLAEYRLRIEDVDGGVVYNQEGTAPLPDSFEWQGVTDQGDDAPAGSYTATLQLRYRNGNAPVVTTEPVTIDRDDPAINLSASYKIFSPDGDGNRDSVTFTQSSSSENRWDARIINEAGEVVYSESWSGRAQDLEWSGADTQGQKVADGTYTYRVSATDPAGNRVQREITGIRIDTRQPSVTISAASEGFSPNGDGRQEELPLELYASFTEGLVDWTVTIRDSSGSAVRELAGGEDAALPETVTWFGGTAEDNTAPSGSYTAELSLQYQKGNRPTATTESSFVLDTQDPSLDPNIQPQPFSPDGDGVDDRVRISLKPEDNRGIATWKVTVLDPGDNAFAQFSGEGAPSEPIVWDGRSEEGERVRAAERYPVRMTVRDPYGNVSRAEADIPVDILVTEEENGDLRIRVTSIRFVPFEADFRNLEDQELVEQNMQTLDRLATVLQEYPEHRIRIEGHAVQIYHNNEELAQEEQEETLIPLSRERAVVVKQALVERGVAEDRMTTAGLGGAEPVVPHGNDEERWKNRRVEFELIRRDSESDSR